MDYEEMGIAPVRRAEKPQIGSRDKKNGPKMAKSRSATGVAGEMLAGTRISRDWETARDLQGRGQRHVNRQTRRRPSNDGAHYSGPSTAGPFVRGPRTDPSDHHAESVSWHDDRVRQVFKQLDPKGLGQVSLDKLQESFQLMRIPLGEDMFWRYAGKYLPKEAKSVSMDDFVNFHKAVWTNQPAAVRHRAGFSGAFIGGSASSASGTSPQRAKTAPASKPGVHDVKDNELQVRTVFRKYAAKGHGRLQFDSLQQVFKDLGLDDHSLMEVESKAKELFNVSDHDHNGSLSFHEFVEFQNRYVASLETLSSAGFGDLFRASAKKVPAELRKL